MIKLRVKIILCFLIISVARQIENINSNELAAFMDFLSAQHLKHALLLLNHVDYSAALGQIESYKKLLAKYRVQFFKKTCPARCAALRPLEELFYQTAPRTGVLVRHFESEHFEVKEFYEATSHGGHFNNTQAWLMLGTQLTGQQDEQLIARQLDGSDINIDADITVGLKQPENSTWLLYDVYRVSYRLETPLLIELKGHWSIEHGYRLLDSFKSSWMIRRRNFGQAILRGSTALLEKPAGYADLQYLENDKQLMQLDPMQRKTYQLLRHMESMYNLSLHIRFTNHWGQLLSNGSWSGVMGHLVGNEADLALCPMRFVLDRQQYIQYTPELHTQYIHFLFRHPRRNNIRNIFFEPLSTQVWFAVLALLVCSTLLLLLHVREECRQRRRQRQRAEHLESRFAFVWFTMLETYLQQGPATDLFRLLSTRLLLFASCVFSFMLMQFYGAFIVGSLLSDSPRSIVTLQALYDSSLAIGMENVSYNFVMFSNSSNRLVREVYLERICQPKAHNILSIDQGAARVKAGGFAFHAAIDRLYRLLVEQLAEQQFCELQEIMFNPPYTSASALPKSSPFREHLNHAVLHLRATGLMQYNDRLWVVPKPDCSLFKAGQVEVDLEHFAPALFTLALAMCASLLVFLLELLVARIVQRQRHMHVG